MGRLSKWSPEFREEAIRLYRESDESVTAVARRLGLAGWEPTSCTSVVAQPVSLASTSNSISSTVFPTPRRPE